MADEDNLSNITGATIGGEETQHSITDTLDSLTDSELVKTMTDLETEVNHLQLENQVFENFLLKNDPSLIAGMAQILETAGRMQVQSTLTPPVSERKDTEDSLQASSRKESVVRFAGTTTVSGVDKGPRINLSQKMDLAMREMEEMQIELENFVKRSHRTKCNLKAELEEIAIRESEVTEARDIFEQQIVIQGMDSLTQRIPAEKFLRYMDEWLKSAEFTIEKMRLRTSTLKSLLLKLSGQLIVKEELGETIDAADFDQLRIQNKHLGEKIEQKNSHLLELKKINGIANLVLSTNKKYLQKQVTEMMTIKNNIDSKEKKIVQLDHECDEVDKDVSDAKEKFEAIERLRENFIVPDVMEYIKIKSHVSEAKKNVKIWERKNNIQLFSLKTAIRKMKNITGIKQSRPSWFSLNDSKHSSSSSSNFGDSRSDVEEEHA